MPHTNQQGTEPGPDLVRTAGALLIAASAAQVLTALLHPESGSALLDPDHGPVGHTWYAAHLLGVGVWPVFGVAFVLLQRELAGRGERLLPLAGLSVFTFAAVSAALSGLLGGFVRPRVAAHYLAAPEGDRGMIRTTYEYNTVVNETLADAYQVALALSVALWSIALIRVGTSAQRVLGWFGAVGGAATAAAFLSGFLSVQAADFHVFVLVNLGYAAWFVALGCLLLRAGSAAAGRGRPTPR